MCLCVCVYGPRLFCEMMPYKAADQNLQQELLDGVWSERNWAELVSFQTGWGFFGSLLFMPLLSVLIISAPSLSSSISLGLCLKTHQLCYRYVWRPQYCRVLKLLKLRSLLAPLEFGLGEVVMFGNDDIDFTSASWLGLFGYNVAFTDSPGSHVPCPVGVSGHMIYIYIYIYMCTSIKTDTEPKPMCVFFYLENVVALSSSYHFLHIH